MLERGLADLGSGHSGLVLNVTERGSAEKAMEACIDTFGGLDILVSNAGAAMAGALLDLSEEALRAAFELNFFPIRSLQSPLQSCSKPKGGRVKSCSTFPNRPSIRVKTLAPMGCRRQRRFS